MPSNALIALKIADMTVTCRPRALDNAMRLNLPEEPYRYDRWWPRFRQLRDHLEDRLAQAGFEVKEIDCLSTLMIIIACQEHDLEPVSGLWLGRSVD